MNPLSQLNKIRILPLLIAPALIALATFTPVSARANTGCGVTTINLLDPVAAGFFPDGLLKLMCNEIRDFGWKFKMDVKGDSDLYLNQLTFTPGAQSGWHSHPGPSLVTVIEGTLTVYHDDCTFETVTAGQSFTDLGCGDIHNVVNETAAEAKDVAVQIVPHGALRRIEADDPGCTQVPACTPTPGPQF
jgi:quercetin dioxygenase-like cupin family protein